MIFQAVMAKVRSLPWNFTETMNETVSLKGELWDFS